MPPAQWKGHDRYRDLPLLGVDPDATWEPVDDGRRPDNSDPEVEGNRLLAMGSRPSNYRGAVVSDDERDPEAGRALMEYHRELAQAQVMSVRSDEMALRTVAL